jgi:hypothetical protein
MDYLSLPLQFFPCNDFQGVVQRRCYSDIGAYGALIFVLMMVPSWPVYDKVLAGVRPSKRKRKNLWAEKNVSKGSHECSRTKL